MPGSRYKPPEVGRQVLVRNKVTGEWIEGTCTEHLSTQWVFEKQGDFHPVFSESFVIHGSWEWKYV